MILLYSGAVKADTPQILAEKSLGGYPSISTIPNGRLNNLFPDISKSNIQSNQFDIRLIVIKNITGNIATNVKVYSALDNNSHIKLKLAAVSPATDGDGKKYFEQVFDSHTLPYQAELNYHNGPENAITIGDMANSDIVGLWVMREIDQSKFPELGDVSQLTAQQLYDLIKDRQTSFNENVIINIDYHN